jgi:TPR repeat protein
MFSKLFLITWFVNPIQPFFHGQVDKPYPPKIPQEQPAAPPTQTQKQWALATYAILTEINEERHDLLGGSERTPNKIESCRFLLVKFWGIHDREDLLEILAWLEKGGHRKAFDRIARSRAGAPVAPTPGIPEQPEPRAYPDDEEQIALKYREEFGAKSIAGWDYSRYIALCGWGYVAGYLTEKEAWEKIMPVARLLQNTFDSWEDLGKNYLVGREFWRPEGEADAIRYCYLKLLAEPTSPWVKLPWKSYLGGAPNTGNRKQPELVAGQYLAKAVAWCRADANLGNAGAQYALGWCYVKGWEVPRDLRMADEYFQQAADKLDAYLQGHLGWYYEHGIEVPKDLTKAAAWYQRAADQGYAAAQNNLGRCYHQGFGVKKDAAKAVEWYQKAAAQGYDSAQDNLGRCYEHGIGVDKDLAKALTYYHQAAAQGYASAQCTLGNWYEDGTCVRKDINKAAAWYQKAAEQGDAIAQFNLALCYYYGKGLAADHKKAVAYYQKAAEQGQVNAQYNLGECYLKGDGIAKDLAKAKEWYQKAAAQGHANAKKDLAALLAKLNQNTNNVSTNRTDNSKKP